MIIATAKAIRPSSSAAAKPMNSRPCWPSAAAGLRIALSRNEPKTLPTPMAAAPTPIAARPAPITCAEAKSMSETPWVELSVKVDCVVEIERRQKREHIGLDRAHQELQRGNADDEEETQQRHPAADRSAVEPADDEASEHFHQDVAGDHRHEESQAQAE